MMEVKVKRLCFGLTFKNLSQIGKQSVKKNPSTLYMLVCVFSFQLNNLPPHSLPSQGDNEMLEMRTDGTLNGFSAQRTNNNNIYSHSPPTTSVFYCEIFNSPYFLPMFLPLIFATIVLPFQFLCQICIANFTKQLT